MVGGWLLPPPLYSGQIQQSVAGVPTFYNNTRVDRRAHNRGQRGKSAARERSGVRGCWRSLAIFYTRGCRRGPLLLSTSRYDGAGLVNSQCLGSSVAQSRHTRAPNTHGAIHLHTHTEHTSPHTHTYTPSGRTSRSPRDGCARHSVCSTQV